MKIIRLIKITEITSLIFVKIKVLQGKINKALTASCLNICPTIFFYINIFKKLVYLKLYRATIITLKYINTNWSYSKV